jgi:ribosome-binding factor A
MRQIPELEFRDDRSMEHAEQIARALKEAERTTVHPAVDTGQDGVR